MLDAGDKPRHDKYMGGQVYVDAERVKKANEALN